MSITGNHHQLTGLKFQVPPPRTLQYLSLSCLELTPLCIHASKVSITLCSLNDLALVSMLDNNRDIKSLLLNSTYKNDELTINLPEVLKITGEHNITFIAPKQLVKINTYEQPVAPHRPDRYNNFQPENNHTDFKNISSRLDQGMLIDKYCQFLRLTFFEDEPLKQKIRKIHQGICEALSLYLKEKSHIELSSFLALAKKWNGKQTELDDHLKEKFTELYYYVNKV